MSREQIQRRMQKSQELTPSMAQSKVPLNIMNRLKTGQGPQRRQIYVSNNEYQQYLQDFMDLPIAVKL